MKPIDVLAEAIFTADDEMNGGVVNEIDRQLNEARWRAVDHEGPDAPILKALEKARRALDRESYRRKEAIRKIASEKGKTDG
jgi:hypothetical protein